MLFHPPVQRHVIIFGPAAQRMQKQHWPSIPTLLQSSTRVGHKQGMAIVHRVPELKSKHGVWENNGTINSIILINCCIKYRISLVSQEGAKKTKIQGSSGESYLTFSN